MMNPRVLELLKNPKNIQPQDLVLLKNEIQKFPYLQSTRALHLYGVHQHDPENYQKELSATAAYTTDKKILYQLINGKILVEKHEVIQEPEIINTTDSSVSEEEDISEEVAKNISVEEKVRSTVSNHDYEAAAAELMAPKPEIKSVFINGERNRILFVGEENFLSEDNKEIIDLESTLESGVIITQKTSSATKEEQTFAQETEQNSENNAKTDASLKKQDWSEEKNAEILSSETIKEKTENPEENFIINAKKDEKLNATAADLPLEDLSASRIEEEIVAEISDDHTQSSMLAEQDLAVNAVPSEETYVEKDIKSPQINPPAEVLINEEQLETLKVESAVQNENELSFHTTSSFLPEIQIQPNIEQNEKPQPQKNQVNKHEEEMRRIIAQVEARMKVKKEDAVMKETEEPVYDFSQTSFSETQAFNVEPQNQLNSDILTEDSEEISVQIITDKEKEVMPVEEESATAATGWRPMMIDSALPDALLNQKKTPEQENIEASTDETKKSDREELLFEVPEEIPAVKEKITEDQSISLQNSSNEPREMRMEIERDEDETDTQNENQQNEQVHVMNVSFFGSDISKIETSAPKIDEPTQQEETQIPSQKNLSPSNIPGFINTWQSWLKIDRSEEVEKKKAAQKSKAIESFIENNPKISQLKEEVNFVVKEKNDDISHLMTETLANLYTEQKLYAKAIKAFHILIEKHPQKQEYFQGKIQEIKELRSRN